MRFSRYSKLIPWYALGIVAGFIILSIFVSAILWCGIMYFAFRDFELFDGIGCVDTTSHEQVEAFAQFKFPLSAENITVFSDRSINDCFVYISFQIPASEAELNAFIASADIDSLVKSRPPSLFSPMPYNLNWSIDLKREYWIGLGRQNNNHQLLVLKDSEQFTVYFVIGAF